MENPEACRASQDSHWDSGDLCIILLLCQKRWHEDLSLDLARVLYYRGMIELSNHGFV